MEAATNFSEVPNDNCTSSLIRTGTEPTSCETIKCNVSSMILLPKFADQEIASLTKIPLLTTFSVLGIDSGTSITTSEVKTLSPDMIAAGKRPLPSADITEDAGISGNILSSTRKIISFDHDDLVWSAQEARSHVKEAVSLVAMPSAKAVTLSCYEESLKVAPGSTIPAQVAPGSTIPALNREKLPEKTVPILSVNTMCGQEGASLSVEELLVPGSELNGTCLDTTTSATYSGKIDQESRLEMTEAVTTVPKSFVEHPLTLASELNKTAPGKDPPYSNEIDQETNIESKEAISPSKESFRHEVVAPNGENLTSASERSLNTASHVLCSVDIGDKSPDSPDSIMSLSLSNNDSDDEESLCIEVKDIGEGGKDNVFHSDIESRPFENDITATEICDDSSEKEANEEALQATSSDKRTVAESLSVFTAGNDGIYHSDTKSESSGAVCGNVSSLLSPDNKSLHKTTVTNSDGHIVKTCSKLDFEKDLADDKIQKAVAEESDLMMEIESFEETRNDIDDKLDDDDDSQLLIDTSKTGGESNSSEDTDTGDEVVTDMSKMMSFISPTPVFLIANKNNQNLDRSLLEGSQKDTNDDLKLADKQKMTSVTVTSTSVVNEDKIPKTLIFEPNPKNPKIVYVHPVKQTMPSTPIHSSSLKTQAPTLIGTGAFPTTATSLLKSVIDQSKLNVLKSVIEEVKTKNSPVKTIGNDVSSKMNPLKSVEENAVFIQIGKSMPAHQQTEVGKAVLSTGELSNVKTSHSSTMVLYSNPVAGMRPAQTVTAAQSKTVADLSTTMPSKIASVKNIASRFDSPVTICSSQRKQVIISPAQKPVTLAVVTVSALSSNRENQTVSTTIRRTFTPVRTIDPSIRVRMIPPSHYPSNNVSTSKSTTIRTIASASVPTGTIQPFQNKKTQIVSSKKAETKFQPYPLQGGPKTVLRPASTVLKTEMPKPTLVGSCFVKGIVGGKQIFTPVTTTFQILNQNSKPSKLQSMTVSCSSSTNTITTKAPVIIVPHASALSLKNTSSAPANFTCAVTYTTAQLGNIQTIMPLKTMNKNMTPITQASSVISKEALQRCMTLLRDNPSVGKQVKDLAVNTLNTLNTTGNIPQSVTNAFPLHNLSSFPNTTPLTVANEKPPVYIVSKKVLPASGNTNPNITTTKLIQSPKGKTFVIQNPTRSTGTSADTTSKPVVLQSVPNQTNVRIVKRDSTCIESTTPKDSGVKNVQDSVLRKALSNPLKTYTVSEALKKSSGNISSGQVVSQTSLANDNISQPQMFIRVGASTVPSAAVTSRVPSANVLTPKTIKTTSSISAIPNSKPLYLPGSVPVYRSDVCSPYAYVSPSSAITVLSTSTHRNPGLKTQVTQADLSAQNKSLGSFNSNFESSNVNTSQHEGPNFVIDSVFSLMQDNDVRGVDAKQKDYKSEEKVYFSYKFDQEVLRAGVKLCKSAKEDSILRKPCFVVLDKVLGTDIVESKCTTICRRNIVKSLCRKIMKRSNRWRKKNRRKLLSAARKSQTVTTNGNKMPLTANEISNPSCTSSQTCSNVRKSIATENSILYPSKPSDSQKATPISNIRSTVASPLNISASGNQTVTDGKGNKFLMIKIDNKTVLIPTLNKADKPKAYVLENTEEKSLNEAIQRITQHHMTSCSDQTNTSVLSVSNSARAVSTTSGYTRSLLPSLPVTSPSCSAGVAHVKVKDEPATKGYGDETGENEKLLVTIKSEPTQTGYDEQEKDKNGGGPTPNKVPRSESTPTFETAAERIKRLKDELKVREQALDELRRKRNTDANNLL